MEKMDEYARVRGEAEAIYKALGQVTCPAFSTGKVHFTSEGFNHLLYSNKTERTKEAQITKLKLVKFVEEVVLKSGTFQEYEEKTQKVVRRIKKKNVHVNATVRYWAFVAVLHGKRIKVIIRRVENGQYHFWSVIPAWNAQKNSGYKVVNNAHGDLTED